MLILEENYLQRVIREEAETHSLVLRIPKDYAKGKTDKIPKELNSENSFELFLTHQDAISKTINVYVYAPNDKEYMAVLLKNGTAHLTPHVKALRNFSKEDRDVIEGFCYMYYGNIIDHCIDDDKMRKSDPSITKYSHGWLLDQARTFRRSELPIRFNKPHVSINNLRYKEYPGDPMNGYVPDLVESSIFDSINFI